MALNDVQKQQVKMGFLAYSQGAAEVSDEMLNQLIIAAVPDALPDFFDAIKGGKPKAGYSLPDFFQIVKRDVRVLSLLLANYPPLQEEPKPAQEDGLDRKVAMGFVD